MTKKCNRVFRKRHSSCPSLSFKYTCLVGEGEGGGGVVAKNFVTF